MHAFISTCMGEKMTTVIADDLRITCTLRIPRVYFQLECNFHVLHSGVSDHLANFSIQEIPLTI